MRSKSKPRTTGQPAGPHRKTERTDAERMVASLTMTKHPFDWMVDQFPNGNCAVTLRCGAVLRLTRGEAKLLAELLTELPIKQPKKSPKKATKP